MAGIPPAFIGAKNRVVTLIGGINTHSNGLPFYFYIQELLRVYLEFGQLPSRTYAFFQHKKPAQGAFPHFYKFSLLSN